MALIKAILVSCVWALPSLGVRAEEALRVQIVEVEESPIMPVLSLVGVLQARDSVDVGFRQGGRIASVFVKEGDRVQKGQELARTDAIQQAQAFQVAKARVDSALATRDQAAQARDRANAMLGHGVSTKAAVDGATQALSAAEGALSQARNDFNQAKRAYDDTVIRAPADAIVTARNGEIGQIVGAAQPVFSLASTAGFEAIFQAPDAAILDRALGASVIIEGIDSSLPTMSARISEISPLVDPHTGSVTVRAWIDNMATDVDFLGAAVHGTVQFAAEAGIKLPWEALTVSGDSPAIWVVGADQRVALTPVAIANFTTDSVIIESGLTAGQRVAAKGAHLLYPGRLVTGAGQ